MRSLLYHFILLTSLQVCLAVKYYYLDVSCVASDLSLPISLQIEVAGGSSGPTATRQVPKVITESIICTLENDNGGVGFMTIQPVHECLTEVDRERQSRIFGFLKDLIHPKRNEIAGITVNYATIANTILEVTLIQCSDPVKQAGEGYDVSYTNAGNPDNGGAVLTEDVIKIPVKITKIVHDEESGVRKNIQVGPFILIPPVPAEHLRFVVTSDTHSTQDKMQANNVYIPHGDVFIHAGDFTRNGAGLAEVQKFNAFLGTLSHKHKLVIAGNHDFTLDSSCIYADKDTNATVSEIRGALTNCTYLQDEVHVIKGVNIYGSPWTPVSGGRNAFKLSPGIQIREKWNMIKGETNILITHGPPKGNGDWSESGNEHAGCEDLAAAVERIKPSRHIYGHIHEAYGISWSGNTISMNVSIVNKQYNPVNPVIVFDHPIPVN